mgnify:CR=1 FL=1
MGGRNRLGAGSLRLWIEQAHRTLVGPAAGSPEEGESPAVGTLQTEEQFCVVLVTWPQGGMEGSVQAHKIAQDLIAAVGQGGGLEEAIGATLAALPAGRYVPIAVLHVVEGRQAALVECDAPPLLLSRRGRLVLPPVVEEECEGRLVRRGEFALQEGDYLAMVSPAYILARGWDRRWGWRDIAQAVRRLTETGGTAEALLGALLRMYHRLAGGEPERSVTVVAMRVRPLRSLTVWSGPPADPARDRKALESFLSESGRRVICGDTTAQLAARLLGAELHVEPRPADGWMEVPPTSTLEGVDLVTEGLVTMRLACQRLQEAKSPQDLPRKEDGATRLARLLLEADVIRFLVGLAVNPAQAADAAGKVPLRRIVVEEMVAELRRKGKIVSVEYI